MKPHHATPAAEPARNFTERYGGWILSACLHVILFSVLLLTRQPAHHFAAAIEPIRVSLSTPEADPLPDALGAAAPEAAPAASAAPALPAPEAAVTIQQAPQLAKLAPPAATPVPSDADVLAPGSLAASLRPAMTLTVGRPDPLKPLSPGDNAPNTQATGPNDDRTDLPFNPHAGGSTEPGPASPDGTYPQGAVSKRGDGVGGPGTEAGSAAVGGRIQTAHAGLIADKTLYAPKNLFAARGASEGAIRSIDLGAAPDENTKEVLSRYGIKVIGAPFNAGAGYLAGQATGREQFVQRFAGGVTAMFSFTSIGAGKMVQLEEDALRKAGYDPANTRIVKVTYGVVNTPRGYDLGVVEMKTEPLILPSSHTISKEQFPTPQGSQSPTNN